MYYLSIDVETCGLNAQTDTLVEIAAILDTFKFHQPVDQLPMFHCYVVHERYEGHPKALAMHAEVFNRIADKTPGFQYLRVEDVQDEFVKWLRMFLPANTKITPAGKNFGNFDREFLLSLPGFRRSGGAVNIKDFQLRARTLDPGSLYFNPKIDTELPSTETCMKRAFPDLNWQTRHTAIEDALSVIKLIRHYYGA